ncbi:hypothetical protein AHF37_01055 [Paragonimus kellicotti]|nr:hypothetical protein AHF37_01055 [Paragonimus kellicotti]
MVASLSNDVLIHGSVFQYSRNDGQLVKSRRWACVTSDSLFVFPDAYNSSACYKVFLEQADIGVSYEDDDSPWITIAERNNSLYYIQPEKAYQFNKWFSAIQRAANPYKGLSKTDSRVIKPFHSSTKLSTNSVFTSDTGKLVSHSQPEAANQLRATNDRCYSPTIPKRITLPWNKLVDNTPSTTDWSPQFVRNRRSPTVSTSRPADRIFNDIDNAPPPRPPRSRLDLQTVKEHPNMRESDVLTTKPLSEIRNLYPVSGLAKRMSISASDLLGKSRDDLILLLLQLNREKANLQRWYDYFMQQMELIRSTKGNTPEARKEMADIRVELEDVTGQLSLSKPLVKFLGNMLRMGDLYGGDDVMFASEYRQHLLSDHEIVPPKPSLNFARDIEEQDVARTLNASRRNFHSIPSLQTGLSNESVNLADWIAQTEMTEAEEASVRRLSHSRGSSLSVGRPFESAAVRQRRIQLEAELADLEALCAPHKVLHQQLRLTQKAISQNERTKESRHLLSDHEIVPPKPSLNFARDIEEQDVARTLNASRRNFHSIPSLQTGLSNESVNLADWIAQTEMTEAERIPRPLSLTRFFVKCGTSVESAAVRQRRIQLEAELADLEALCAPHKVLHQQLRLTQKAISQNERTKESRGPAAALLRRLRMNQTDHVNRSSTDIRSRDFRDNSYHDENQPFYNSNQLLAATESHRRVSQPYERGQFSTSAFNSGRFTPIGSKQSFEQGSFLKRFRSIPDHIDLLSDAGYPTDRLQLRNMDWKSRPSSPSLTSSKLEDLPTKFAPVRSSMTKQGNQNLTGDGPDPQPIDVISQRDGLNTARSTPVSQPHWGRKLSQDSGDLADSFARRDCTPQNVSRSDSMNAVTPVASSHTLSPPRYEPYRRRRTDSSPGSTQLEKFPATRMQMHFDELLHDADKPWNSNAESQRGRQFRLGQDSSDSLERRHVEWSDDYNTEVTVPVSRPVENSALQMQFVSSFTNSASSVLPGRSNNRPSEVKRLDTDTPWVEEQIVPVSLKPKQSLRTDAIIAQSGDNNGAKNKSNTTEGHRKYHSRKTRLESSPPRKLTNEPLIAIDAITGCRLSAMINDEDDVESLLMETPQGSDEPDRASPSHSDVDHRRNQLETRRFRTNRDLEVKYDGAAVLPSAKIKMSGSSPTTSSVILKLIAIDAITGCRLSAMINDEDDVESLLMETPQGSDEPDRASPSHSDVDHRRNQLETRRFRTNRDLEVKYDGAAVLPSAKIKMSGSSPTTSSVILKFSPPEPMEIRERYVPSPPPFERCDSEYRRNKEVKMNALRNVLLRQSFAGDSVQDFDQEQREEFPGHRADWIKQRTQLLSMQHRLAKEAVASAGNISGKCALLKFVISWTQPLSTTVSIT